MTEGVDDAADEGGISLGDLWGVLQMQRRVILGALLLTVAASVLFTMMVERQYTAVAVVHLTPVAPMEVQTDGLNTDVTAVWNRKIDVATKLQILQSKTVRQEVVDQYREQYPDGDATGAASSAGAFGKALEVKSRRGTELIDIRVTTDDPEKAARLANIMAMVFRGEAQQANIDAAQSATEWIDQQLQLYGERVSEATTRLNAFERANGLAGSSSEGEATLATRMTSLNEAYADINTQVVLQQTLVDDYERLLRSGRYKDLSKAIESAAIGELARRYAEASSTFAMVKQTYKSKMPQYKEAESRLQNVEQALVAEVRRTLSAEKAKLEILVAQEESIREALGGGKEQILAQQMLWGEYEQLRNEVTNAKAFRDRLQSRRGELELQSKTQFNRVRILEQATPPSGFSYPVVHVNLAGGVFVGLVLGFGVAFAREWFDDSISSPHDVKTYLRAPFLGAIPRLEQDIDESSRAMFSFSHPRSAIAEAVRGVRAALDLNPRHGVPRRIMVTSALSSEGKTSTAVRLAVAYATSHRSAVIVDCDLRRPRVHKVFGGHRDTGVASVVAGEPVEEAIFPTPIPRVSYVPAGHGGERPDEVLSSPSIAEMFDALAEKFDVVIVDTPPTAIVADSKLLSRHVEGVVMVVRENSTARSVAREAVTGLAHVGATIFGVVINSVDFTKRRTSYKYYSYGYNYSYETEDVASGTVAGG